MDGLLLYDCLLLCVVVEDIAKKMYLLDHLKSINRFSLDTSYSPDDLASYMFNN